MKRGTLRFCRYAAIAAGLGFAAGTLGCGSSATGTTPARAALPAAVAAAVSRDTPVSSRTVTANNQFALTMLARLRASATPDQNVFISPTSLALALEIAYNGAKGETRTGMAKALQLQADSDDVLNADNAALQASLVDADPAVTINVANSLWVRGNTIQASFVALNEEFYGSELGDVAGAPDNVNAWVSDKTNGKIAGILPPGDYSRTVFVIANAIYFNAVWSRVFDPGLTSDSLFTNSDGSQSTVKMMHGEGTYAYFRGPHFQAIRLPYGTGRLSMLLFLPDSDSSLTGLLDGLTLPIWNDWVAKFQTKEGRLGLPKVTSSYGGAVNNPLKALGMDAAFDPSRADLTGIAQVPGAKVYLQAVYHKTFLKIDEKGTEAAAATGVVGGVTSAPLFDFEMTLDRPFLTAIRDEKTGVILFLGTVVHP